MINETALESELRLLQQIAETVLPDHAADRWRAVKDALQRHSRYVEAYTKAEETIRARYPHLVD